MKTKEKELREAVDEMKKATGPKPDRLLLDPADYKELKKSQIAKYDPALVSILVDGQKVDGLVEDDRPAEVLICRLVDGLSRSYFRALLIVKAADVRFLNIAIRSWSATFAPKAGNPDNPESSGRLFWASPDYYRESKFFVVGNWKVFRIDLDKEVKSGKSFSKLRADRKAIELAARAIDRELLKAVRKERDHDPIL